MGPVCSNCNADAVAFAVPGAIREHAPKGTEYASICRVCLTVEPLDEAPAETESLAAVSQSLPEDRDVAATVAVLVGLLESIALNRPAIEAVIDHLEAEGVDPLLVVSRLAADETLTPAIDLDRRLHQVEQLLS